MMEKENVLDVLRSLADGVNPVTGELFLDNSPYQHPMIIRTLYSAIHLLDSSTRKTASKANKPGNAGKPWRPEDDQALAEAFSQGLSETDMARQLERTVFAIEARLIKLGHKEPTADMAYALSSARAR